MVNESQGSVENSKSQTGVIWKIKKFVKSVKDHINNALDREKIKDEWKQNIVKEFRMLSPEEKKKVKDCLVSYFKVENSDHKRSYLPNFYLSNGKVVDPLNEHVFDLDHGNARKDAIIDQIRPYFQSVDWSDKNINRMIFDFLPEFGIEVKPSILLEALHIW